MNNGYSVNLRQDKRTGEYLAVVPTAYVSIRGDRYYMAICSEDGDFAELTPGYVTRYTRTVKTYPATFKRYVDVRFGYIMNLAPRLYG